MIVIVVLDGVLFRFQLYYTFKPETAGKEKREKSSDLRIQGIGSKVVCLVKIHLIFCIHYLYSFVFEQILDG